MDNSSDSDSNLLKNIVRSDPGEMEQTITINNDSGADLVTVTENSTNEIVDDNDDINEIQISNDNTSDADIDSDTKSELENETVVNRIIDVEQKPEVTEKSEIQSEVVKNILFQLKGENNIWTSDPRKEIKREVYDNIEAITIPEALDIAVKKYRYKSLFTYERNEMTVVKTWLEFYDDVQKFAYGLVELGLEEYKSVMIQGFNSYEWVVAHFGTIFAGGISSGVYTTNKPEVCKYMIEDCDAQVLVVENVKQLEKYREFVDDLKDKIKAIIIWSDFDNIDRFWYSNERPFPLIHFCDFVYPRFVSEPKLQEMKRRSKSLTPWRCQSLIYTSGTTGYPKGVMISHDNVCWVSQVVMKLFSLGHTDRGVSYLPLSHIAAQALDLFIPLFTGASITFATPDALKGGLANTLKKVQPTFFFGVPRVWEKIMEKIKAKSRKSGGCLKSIIVRNAKDVGLRATRCRELRLPMPYGYAFSKNLVFNKVKEALGLTMCKYFMTGAAPISDLTLDFFASLDIPIMNLYGASETTGPITFNVPDRFKMYIEDEFNVQRKISCGSGFTGEIVKLDRFDYKTRNGEIICKGRHVFMGYINKREKTSEVFDEEGFYHTGDKGYLDEQGYLTITGRYKEILITKGGENIAPVLIENNIKNEIKDIVSNVVVIGDDKKYLTCLVTLKCAENPDGSFQSVLSQETSELLAYPSDYTNDENVKAVIQSAIDSANMKAVSRAQTVKKFVIIPGDFSVPGGELTPTMKLKRPIINKKYASYIDGLYSS